MSMGKMNDQKKHSRRFPREPKKGGTIVGQNRRTMKKGANHNLANPLIILARPARFERATFRFVV